ncbi:MAG: hypothetical protein QW101_05025 [Ignisphaera sp.]
MSTDDEYANFLESLAKRFIEELVVTAKMIKKKEGVSRANQ